MIKNIVCLVLFLLPCMIYAAPLMYVPRGNANDLIIINLDTDKIKSRIPELENAHGLAASPGSDYLVAGSMQIPEESTSGTNKPAAVSDDEHAAHHAAGAEQSELNTKSFVSIVHPQHGHVMRRVAVRGLTHHTAVSPNGNYAIAVHPGSGGISVIDLKSMEVVKEIQTGQTPNYAVITSNSNRVYISNALSGSVSEIDAQKWQVKREFKTGREPEHMVLSPNESQLYVLNVADGDVAVVDLASGTISKRYKIGKDPHGIDVSQDGRWMFVSVKAEGKLVRIDLRSHEQSAIDLQPAPYHLEYVDEVKKLYVSSHKKPLIWIIDPTTLSVTGDINIDKGIAHQMVVLDR